ncbi:hypothetical protein STEG23_021899 [Scotinomys teguina]
MLSQPDPELFYPIRNINDFEGKEEKNIRYWSPLTSEKVILHGKMHEGSLKNVVENKLHFPTGKEDSFLVSLKKLWRTNSTSTQIHPGDSISWFSGERLCMADSTVTLDKGQPQQTCRSQETLKKLDIWNRMEIYKKSNVRTIVGGDQQGVKQADSIPLIPALREGAIAVGPEQSQTFCLELAQGPDADHGKPNNLEVLVK